MQPLELPAGLDVDVPPPGVPLMWRLSSVATLLGVAPETLEGDCDAGRLPIRIARYGARQLPYLNSGDVVAHLRTVAAARKAQQ